MPPIARHGKHASSSPTLHMTSISASSSNVHNPKLKSAKERSARSVPKQEITADTFYDAMAGVRPQLSPRTANAGSFTRRLLDKDWNLLQEYDNVAHLLQEEANFRRMQMDQNKHRSVLEMQRDEAKKRLAQEKQEWRDFGQTLEQDAVKYKKEEQGKMTQRKEDDLAERRARDDQWTDMQKRKEAERALEKHEIGKMLNAAQKAIGDEENKQRAKAEKLKGWAETSKAENAAALERRKIQKLADAAEDKRLMLVQKEMMDKAEENRAGYFTRLKGKQESNQAAFEKSAGAEEAKKTQMEKERIAREIQEKFDKDTESAEKKAQWLSNLAKEGVAAVQRQLLEQDERRQRQKEEDERFGEQFVREAKLYRDEEAAKKMERRKQAKENQEFLRSQIATHKKLGKFGEIDMSRTEQAINHSMLDQAKNVRGQEAIFRNMQLQLLLSAEKNNLGSPKSPGRNAVNITREPRRRSAKKH